MFVDFDGNRIPVEVVEEDGFVSKHTGKTLKKLKVRTIATGDKANEWLLEHHSPVQAGDRLTLRCRRWPDAPQRLPGALAGKQPGLVPGPGLLLRFRGGLGGAQRPDQHPQDQVHRPAAGAHPVPAGHRAGARPHSPHLHPARGEGARVGHRAGSDQGGDAGPGQ